MWTTHKLEDLIGDPLLARFAPGSSAAIESVKDSIDQVADKNESDVMRAGVLLYGVEILVKVVNSYFFACLIVHFFADRKLKASNQALERTASAE